MKLSALVALKAIARNLRRIQRLNRHRAALPLVRRLIDHPKAAAVKLAIDAVRVVEK